ncbi:hypothetical protein C7212DRAFT_322365 [Tuber magnatum]|uniref:Uncharacterized protein n=1 Tax=Tuber magnatum TaxID=42249 RepID=A0A317SPT1_9PEZI|nr:hypothetical protein C7212DRAFT_322365 [Tuber magnatum]
MIRYASKSEAFLSEIVYHRTSTVDMETPSQHRPENDDTSAPESKSGPFDLAARAQNRRNAIIYYRQCTRTRTVFSILSLSPTPPLDCASSLPSFLPSFLLSFRAYHLPYRYSYSSGAPLGPLYAPPPANAENKSNTSIDKVRFRGNRHKSTNYR